MEAPKKIYVGIIPSDLGNYTYITVEKDFPNAIEYTRTDALIEKMFNFLSEKYLIKTKEPLRWVPIRQVIEDFKKYMEK